MKIYTRTGDAGETGLFDGSRIPKSDGRVDACGEIDELNAAIGLSLADGMDADVAVMLQAVQRDLHAVGSRLADPDRRIAERVRKATMAPADIARVEEWIDRLEAELPPLRRFILPGGSPAGARLHVARTICRRAERRIVALGADRVEPEILAYVNRLSDFLFVAARAVSRRAGVPELEW